MFEFSKNNKNVKRQIIMGLIIPSLIALCLTMAGLFTTKTFPFSQNSDQMHIDQVDSNYILEKLPRNKESNQLFHSNQRRHVIPQRISRNDNNFFDHYFGGMSVERSDFMYVLPILLVIGLGSFLIPIISTFFTAIVTSSSGVGGCCGRRKRHQSFYGEIKNAFGLNNLQDLWYKFEKAIEKFS